MMKKMLTIQFFAVPMVRNANWMHRSKLTKLRRKNLCWMILRPPLILLDDQTSTFGEFLFGYHAWRGMTWICQAKRLLLGLHERFWHSSASDLQSLLSKSGMPSGVLKLVPEVVAGCAICKKYSRLKSRPVVKANHPATFGEEVQTDYFQLWNEWFMIFVDVATRYKVVVKVAGRDLPTALHALLHNWLRFFGPMRKLVSDQESCLMSHEAAAELERLNIHREPAGTTRGKAQGQHTTTGLVEKHTDLVKIQMLKIKAEAERAGIDVSFADIAAEAGFSQNASVNIGGVTPHMMVTGSMPFPFYDIDGAGIQAVSGSDMTRPTVFENALRLRQIALSSAAQAITENRILRAGHTRPHNVCQRSQCNLV